MRKMKKISIFVVLFLVVSTLFSVVAFAAGSSEAEVDSKPHMEYKPADFGERLEYAVQGTVTGILMVFSVLTLLCIILYGSKLVFYDLPNNKKKKKQLAAASVNDAPNSVEETLTEVGGSTEAVPATDDGELAAVITAAIAAMIDGGDYKDEFVGGFRVVSFKRSTSKAWNRK